MPGVEEDRVLGEIGALTAQLKAQRLSPETSRDAQRTEIQRIEYALSSQWIRLRELRVGPRV